MSFRSLSRLDRMIAEVERSLSAVFEPAPVAVRASPASDVRKPTLDDVERRRSAGLMRVNHVGEVCAQALYFGQAFVARTDATRQHLLDAAAEETDHLAWCGQRLRELDSRPSFLNPLWYGGAWTIGAVAGLVGDPVSLGFVVETERQVEAHLDGHLQKLPEQDLASRAIVQQMKSDEARHAESAEAAGGVALPAPVTALMRVAANVMRAVAYRV
ncbi:MAG: 2-polyprenyl-3-methyl-6-methoxy-1,4-benzoquinone monooxygenase [Dokdonella sp.]